MRKVLLSLALALIAGCVVPTQSRFPADVATALREQPMRRLETDSLLVYYPESRRDEALRLAERAEACAMALRSRVLIHNGYADQKMVLVVPDLPFNNAFVAPSALGARPVAVIPISNTLDFTSELGVPPDPSYVGCHELVHYVHALQVSGVWGWINRWIGDVLSPQVGLDVWFWEGLATYYESKLQPGTGRMTWPAWRGAFHAGFANKRVNGGDLSASQRPFHWGNHYLVGSHFVEFIAERYGERALWKLVATQGDSVLFPLGVALRWRSATGKTLPTLVDEFASHVEKQFPRRPKPAKQREVRAAGSAARYAVSSSGREALILSDAELPTLLRIYDGGRLIRERNLVEVLPPRTLATAHPLVTSGLSFTGDGEQLYFVSIDRGDTQQEARLLRYEVESDRLEVVMPRLGGSGGGVDAVGSTYYYSRADGDRRHLAAIDLATGAARIVRAAEARTYYESARPSPDGARIATAVFDGQRFVIRVMDASSGQTEAQIAVAGAVQDPSWVDDERVLLLAEEQGRFQVYLYELATGAMTKVSDAPYLAFQPRAHGDSIRFLNREGWHWTVDEVPMPEAPDSERTASTPTWRGKHPSGGPQASPVTRDVHVLSDEAYSQTDDLFAPSLHTPMLFAPGDGASLAGLQLSGGDRLSFHRWTVFGLYDVLGKRLSGGLQYATALLAPIDLRLEVDRLAWNEVIRNADNTTEAGPFHSQERALIALGRSFRTSRVELSALGLEENDPSHPEMAFRQRRLAGPRFDVAHQAYESSPYAGRRRGFSLSGTSTYFDQSLSTLGLDLTDLGARLGLVTPLPISRRHTLGLSLRGRRLVGLERENGFLQVGGGGGLAELWNKSDRPEQGPPSLPQPEPLLEFQEPLRGFEDFAFATDRIAIGELTYRYPLILDFGISSTAYLLPSLFFRQIDLELFAAAATDSFANFKGHRRAALGGSAELSMTLWLVPLRIRYQLARRLTDDDALVHSIAIGN